MNAFIDTQCPYCGKASRQTVEMEYSHFWNPIKVLVCDTETGGCDKPYAVRFRFNPEVRIYKLEEVPEPKTELEAKGSQ